MDPFKKSSYITSFRIAALTAGVSLLAMAIVAPLSELYMFPQLVLFGNISETARNIQVHESLFRTCILCYLLTFMLDIIAAWALFILLKPVNQHLSLLTGWFRLVYAIIALSALTNLVTVLPILHNTNFAKTFQPGLQNIQIDLSISAFKNGWYFGLIFFGIHLGLLGYLVFRSGYIPKILGILLVISALGYFLNAVRPYLFPSANLDFAKYTFFGELIFMVWLLIRGPMIKEQS